MLLAGPIFSDRAGMSVWVLSGGFVWVSIAFFSAPEEWLTLGLSFHFFTGGICPGVYSIMAVAAPRKDVHAIGGAYFFSDRVGMSVWVLSGRFVWVSITSFSAPEELVQASALFWPCLPPWADNFATGGDCFFCWGRSECMGFEWFFFVRASVSSGGE